MNIMAQDKSRIGIARDKNSARMQGSWLPKSTKQIEDHLQHKRNLAVLNEINYMAKYRMILVRLIQGLEGEVNHCISMKAMLTANKQRLVVKDWVSVMAVLWRAMSQMGIKI